MTEQNSSSGTSSLAKAIAQVAGNLPTNTIKTTARELSNTVSLMHGLVDQLLTVADQLDHGVKAGSDSGFADVQNVLGQIADHGVSLITNLNQLVSRGGGTPPPTS